MFHTFDTQLQLFPWLAAEHIMLSIAEWARMSELDFSKHIIFSPSDVSLFSLGVLGSLYYRLSLRSSTRRIIYIRSDADLYPGTIHIPSSAGVSQVLGKKVLYDASIISWLFGDNIVQDDLYFTKSDFRYTHAHHVSFLENIEVLPIVFADKADISAYTDKVISLFSSDLDTVIILSDDITFRIEETTRWPQILALKTQHYTWFDFFCTYCDMHVLVPHIMKVEVVQHTDGDTIYQGLLAV
jgi:hypothetical protein